MPKLLSEVLFPARAVQHADISQGKLLDGTSCVERYRPLHLSSSHAHYPIDKPQRADHAGAEYLATARSRMEASNSHNTNAPTKTLNSTAPHHAAEPVGQQGTTDGELRTNKPNTNRISVASPSVRERGQNERHLSSRAKALERTIIPTIRQKIPPKPPRPWIAAEMVGFSPLMACSREAASVPKRNIPARIQPAPKTPIRTEPTRNALDGMTARLRPADSASPPSPRATNAAMEMLP